MDGDRLNATAQAVESTGDVGSELRSNVVEAIRSAFPEPARLLRPDSDLLNSTDAALHIVDALVPAWEISIKGVALEYDGHWVCTLRETSSPDNEMIGVGRAPSLPRALIAALLRIAALRAGR